MYPQIYLSLGSNKGNRLFNLERALLIINQHVAPVYSLSSIYSTEPWGELQRGAPPFLNQVASISASIPARLLLERLQAIEWCLGRMDTKNRHLPRPMDIDILLFEDQMIRHSDLIVPHPRMHLRRFVLTPLAEIAPDIIHPLLGDSIAQLLRNCKDPLSVKFYNPDEDD